VFSGTNWGFRNAKSITQEICFLELIRVSEMLKHKTRNLFLIIENKDENYEHVLFDLWKCQEHKPVPWDLEA
jgi:hypothetical protein